jgi:(1->4)-alpha-D-glucan 1-alpha-D-glucosylmutase
VDGTTGYDFANLVGGLLLNPDGEGPLTRIHARFTGRGEPFEEVAYACKRLITRVQLSSELTVLASLLNDLSEADRHTRDFTLNGLREALREVVVCFPVYRTYITEQGAGEEDRRYVDWAVAQAKRRSPAADLAVFDFIRRVLLLEGFDRDGALRALAVRFAMRFQQYTAPVLAKGVEDTAFYRHTRLLSLNEVGGEPGRFGVSLAAFHHANAQRARHWPHAMLTLATHDSKRSGDLRARLAVLSELSGEWRAALGRWRRLNRRRRRAVEGRPAPTANDEYLLYQTLVGVWPTHADTVKAPEGDPVLTERVQGFILKALREAKELTSWINPNEDYEQAVTAFVRRLLAEPAGRRLRADLDGFARRIAYFGALNTLSQTLLHLSAPGVPDLYQGSEALAFHLVDPDNRRPVDFAALQGSLDALREHETDPRGLLQDLHDGRAKQYLTWRTLSLRRRLPAAFLDGDYLPLTAQGERAEHVCAYARRHAETTVIAVAPRWPATLTGGREVPPLGEVWGDTRLPLPEGTQTLRDALTGTTATGPGPLPLSRLLADLPVALLVHEPDNPRSTTTVDTYRDARAPSKTR